ncbi:MAG: hypothetical protein GX362_01170 [Methanosarcinaceae archaeon]|nr:hypothetical protein [Methanosarcinaceae archaeon]
MTYESKIQKRDTILICVFFVSLLGAVNIYASYIGSINFSVSLIFTVPWLMCFTIPSKVLSSIWKATASFLSMALVACYFGEAWPLVYKITNGDYIVLNSTGLYGYLNILSIISILFVLLIIYYKVKIKKVSIYD